MSSQEQPLINRVAQSSLLTINLEDFFPASTFGHFDIKDYLFKGLILKEKDFRLALKEYDWSQHENQLLLIYCSVDAIIPVWAYMLVASKAAPFATEIFQGSQEAYLKYFFQKELQQLDLEKYRDQKIVIKGCGEQPVPVSAYTQVVHLLQPIAKSIMYGEPCSTVPIFKQKNKK